MRPLTWMDALNVIQTGDILLCRGNSAMGKAISRVTKSPYVHAAMAGWIRLGWSNTACLVMGETVQQHAARIIDLQGEVVRYPGLYDIYRVREGYCNYDPCMAFDWMRQASGGGYGWGAILQIWLRRRVSSKFPPVPNSDDPQFNRDCSGLVQSALRHSGGPISAVHDSDVAPGDLAHTLLTRYIGTLYHTDEQVADALRRMY